MSHNLITVLYKRKKVCVAFYDEDSGRTSVEYVPEFLKTGINLSPIKMPARRGIFEFPRLDKSFWGLPGMLADCLPDAYGNTLINEWLRSQGRDPGSLTPVERLAYMGKRSMGALEFEPSIGPKPKAKPIDVELLVELASEALSVKEGLHAKLEDKDNLEQIISVGSSAGGARAKAVIAWNPETNEVRSGQIDAPTGFEHWLLKLDGVSTSFEGIRDPQGYGKIEYAYYLMAKDSGINISECRLFREGDRAHFMTKRFDRRKGGEKVHYASLFGINHMSYCVPSEHNHSYEDYFDVVDALDLGPDSKQQAFRRMCFNVLAYNHDDHVKNFGFLMDESGQWSLAPAFDLSYAHNPNPQGWTNKQQMSVNGKRDSILVDDLIACGRNCNVGTVPKIKSIIGNVRDALACWMAYAETANVDARNAEGIERILAI